MLEQIQTATSSVVILPMEYRAIASPGVEMELSQIGSNDSANTSGIEEFQERIHRLEQELEDRVHAHDAALLSARSEAAEAFEAGRQSERSAQSAQLAATTQALTTALQEFASLRDHYLAEVEREVVRLALAIAARVLRRETLMDPLLLTGAVRVALGQLSGTTEVRLRVPVAEAEMWRETMHLMPNLPLDPEIVPDKALKVGECALETRLGNVDLGVRSQLEEIERGFFDLLETRERTVAAAGATDS